MTQELVEFFSIRDIRSNGRRDPERSSGERREAERGRSGRDRLLYLNKSRDCLQWHRFTHEAAAVLYSFLESRCHLSAPDWSVGELRERESREGRARPPRSPGRRSPRRSPPRGGFDLRRDLTPLLFYPLRRCSRDCGTPRRQSSPGKGMTPARLFLHGFHRPLDEKESVSPRERSRALRPPPD